ncbi:MAG: hypothetical protein HKN20_07565 [Gemmatimonadetes bacterium]|nr:hypothetical protein [Gemmatimonadota bacterium]
MNRLSFYRLPAAFVCLAAALLLSAPAAEAQLEDQLSAYTGVNAEGYLGPLADAFGSNLNSGLYHTASIGGFGPQVSLEIKAMAVKFGDDDRFFTAQTEGFFVGPESGEAPTVVGPTEGVTVEGDGGAMYTFPGGFDVSSFGLAAPQIRIGAVAGTEALVRYFAAEFGSEGETTELGDVSLFGFGVRHSLSQYLGAVFPVALSAGFFYQTLDVGKTASGADFIASEALSIGVQASKDFGFVEPYAGLSFDSFNMDVTYDSDSDDSEDPIKLSFDSEKTAHLAMGVTLKVPFVSVNGEFNVAGQNSFAVGLAVGN